MENTKRFKKLRFMMKTKPNCNGNVVHIIIEKHGEDKFMAQLVSGPSHDVNDLHSTTLVLDHFKTLEKACDAVNYPYDVIGLPVLI